MAVQVPGSRGHTKHYVAVRVQKLGSSWITCTLYNVIVGVKVSGNRESASTMKQKDYKGQITSGVQVPGKKESSGVRS